MVSWQEWKGHEDKYYEWKRLPQCKSLNSGMQLLYLIWYEFDRVQNIMKTSIDSNFCQKGDAVWRPGSLTGLMREFLLLLVDTLVFCFHLFHLLSTKELTSDTYKDLHPQTIQMKSPNMILEISNFMWDIIKGISCYKITVVASSNFQPFVLNAFELTANAIINTQRVTFWIEIL